MERLNRRSLLVLLAFSVAFAGCATSDPAPGDDNGQPPTGNAPAATSPEEARNLLRQASGSPPDQFGMRATLTSQAGQALFYANGTFDNATRSSYVEMRGDTETLGTVFQGQPGFSDVFGAGFAMYVKGDVAMYVMNGTALVFPNASDDGAAGALPSPQDGPMGSFLDPAMLLGVLAEENVTVNSATPTVHRGKPALQVSVTRNDDGRAQNATAIVYTSPARIARFEGTLPTDEASPADPTYGARFAVDFLYDGEVNLAVPEGVARAAGLAYDTDRDLFSFGEPAKSFTWTFLVDGGVAVEDVEIQIKDAAVGSSEDVRGMADVPTLWSMRLDEGTKTQDGVTLTFTDADADGEVSQGDTLRVDMENPEEAPTVVLLDTKTGIYVVPGPGALLGLAALGVAALVLRRRRD